ncbi:HipA family kinase [Marinobacter maritimus]|uniref:HipA family kinase n=1 Tax=Marinobacter maritimus TaxID=277961 RepID=UPI00119CA27E|nr:HipA family kinase [Marinobacter maritimus]
MSKEATSKATEQHSSNAANAAQRLLFPVELTEIYRNDIGTADCQTIGTATNGKDYAIKTVNEGNGHIPSSELFSYELARELQIATPEYNIIKMRDESLAFGSMWEGGALDIRNQQVILGILQGEIIVRGLKSFFSKVYALDIFINNIDRHFGNYLFRGGYNSTIALAYDYSRAWYAFAPFDYQSASDPVQNTYRCHVTIKKFDMFDKIVTQNTLDEISRIPKDTIDQILSLIPEQWLNSNERNDFLNWWADGSMQERVGILKGSVN